jgi:hypothetical protein
MTKLKLEFSKESNLDCVELFLDNQKFSFQIENGAVTANIDLLAGLHFLKMKVTKPTPIEVTNFFVDDVPIRHYLYMSWMEVNGSKYQPCCEVNQTDQTWTLPFANPLSLWYSICSEKIANGLYGSNLYDKFEIVYPESVDVGDQYPKEVQDFFKQNFDFVVYDKKLKSTPWHRPEVPYVKVKLNYDYDALKQELFENKELILQHKKFMTGNSYNPVATWDRWAVISTIDWMDKNNPSDWRTRTVNSLMDHLPNLRSFYEQLPVGEIYYANIGYLPPRGFGAPHIDIEYPCRTPEYAQGMANLHVPINVAPGLYLKMGRGGLLPTDGPTVMNNYGFTHSLVNNSDQIRFSLGTHCDMRQGLPLVF